jgi:hypothetical protein
MTRYLTHNLISLAVSLSLLVAMAVIWRVLGPMVVS